MLHSRAVPIVVTLTLSLVAGCSDDPQTPATDSGASDLGVDVPSSADVTDASAPTDATGDVAGDVTTDAPNDGGAGCTLSRVLVTTSTFGAGGGYATGTVTPPSLAPSTRTAPDQDHVPVQSNCLTFDLLRTNDAVEVLDPGSLPAARRTIPLRSLVTVDAGGGGNQTNPYDALVVSASKAYVALYALPRVAVINPSVDGASGVTGSVNLAPVLATGDTDGAPEASVLVGAGPRAYVLLQNLAAFAPVANGTIAVIDTTTDALVDMDPVAAGTQPITLTGRNPQAMVLAGTTSLVVAHTGAYGALDGGLERVDLATGRASGVEVTETQLGGDLSGVVMLDATRGWALVNRMASGDAGTSYSRVVEFDLAARTVREAPVLEAGPFNLAGLARDPTGSVWVLDRTPGRSGVRVYRPAPSGGGVEVTTAPLGTGTHAPSGLAFVP